MACEVSETESDAIGALEGSRSLPPVIPVVNPRQSPVTQPMESLVDSSGDTRTKQPWVDVISENRAHDRGLTVKYFAPTIVNGEVFVLIDEQDVESEMAYWENALIMFAFGR